MWPLWVKEKAAMSFRLFYLTIVNIYSFPTRLRSLTHKGKIWLAITCTCLSVVGINTCMSYVLDGFARTDTLFEGQSISLWLKENNHQNITPIFQSTGNDNDELSSVNLDYFNTLETIPHEVKSKLKKAIQFAQEMKILNLWLNVEYSIPVSVIERLNNMGIKSVSALSKLSENNHDDVQTIEKIVDGDIPVYAYMLKAIKAAKTIKTDLLMIDYYQSARKTPGNSFVFKILFLIATVFIGGFILCFIMVVDCIARAISPTIRRANQIHNHIPQIPRTGIPRLSPGNNSKGWFWNWLVGSYISTQNCSVTWGWEEPQAVGNTMSFVIQLSQKNGKSYKINDVSNVNIEILHKGEKMSCTKNIVKDNASSVSVSFTVHKAGPYKIHVMVHGKHIKGSPFIKVFDAGSIDATKTGFTNYCSTIVCTVGQSYPLVIETRDCYDNPAMFKTDTKNYFKFKVYESETNERYVPTTQIIHNADSKQLTMHIKMENEGCYQAAVSYGDVKLRNGDFNILVISDDDLEVVNKTTSKKSHNLWYEARLLSDTADSAEKAKRVYVYISPKQLTIKEYFLKIIGKKLHTWRVCPSTKFSFIGYNKRYDAPVMKIYGCSQLPVMLATKDRNIIAATFTNFLLRNIGGSETFQDKRIFFLQEVKKSTKKGNVTLKIDRANLLQSSYKASKSLYASDWFKMFNIEFINELGLDWGGLRREWIQVLSTELFDPDKSGLFTRFTDNAQGLIHPRPNTGVKLKLYELAGKLVGKCLLDSSLGSTSQLYIKANFSRSFLAQIIGLQVNYKYFETDDPDLYKTKIKFIEDNSIEDMDLTFSEDEYVDGHLVKTVDLVLNGSKMNVTDDNKLYYLNCLAQYKLVSGVKEEVESFLKGLNAIIPDNLLSIFDENELELLMCGTDNYSFSDFKQNAVISGDFAGSKLLEWFWAIVASFTDEQMARLLQFTTGSSQLPPGGFKDLDPNFTISFTSYSTNSLPTAHTCFNQLCLPSYTSMEQMHKCMITAITEGFQGFGFA
ncbi:apoptosis-resistant E3 ubiquitin protein ligase 1-like isoform X1 [Mytilus edulis]|uniref:apoptosis-resistant E3 ubiquitin protein ligase 1-like isoform X1 n=2 Tax=Mytilus edulis TaxID=6550 RepID=UPI0039EEB75D